MLGWLITVYSLSQNTMHSTSRSLFILLAKQSLESGVERGYIHSFVASRKDNGEQLQLVAVGRGLVNSKHLCSCTLEGPLIKDA